MVTTVKLVVAGAGEGPYEKFVASISEVKVRSSSHEGRDGSIPVDLGRVRIGVDLNLHIFGVDRHQMGPILNAVGPGLVGAIFLLTPDDFADSSELDHISADYFKLREKEVPVVLGWTGPTLAADEVRGAVGAPPEVPVVACNPEDRSSVKAALLALFQAALKIFTPAV